jgi:hypothetical protein
VLTTQYGDLLAQRQPSGQPDEHQIQHPYRHEPTILPDDQPPPLARSLVS